MLIVFVFLQVTYYFMQIPLMQNQHHRQIEAATSPWRRLRLAPGEQGYEIAEREMPEG